MEYYNERHQLTQADIKKYAKQIVGNGLFKASYKWIKKFMSRFPEVQNAVYCRAYQQLEGAQNNGNLYQVPKYRGRFEEQEDTWNQNASQAQWNNYDSYPNGELMSHNKANHPMNGHINGNQEKKDEGEPLWTHYWDNGMGNIYKENQP